MTSDADTDNRFGYERLKALAAELHRPLHTLIALADDNDPHLADRPGRRRQGAQWFAQVWERLGAPHGSHLRRLHYLLLGLALPDGSPYLNTHKCWKLLGSASADARYLNLVPAFAFEDRRAPEPVIYTPDDRGTESDLCVYSSEPSLSAQSSDDVPLLHYSPAKYDLPPLPELVLQRPRLMEPYALELWVEKSTQNDWLLPLARAERVTLVTGVGELSITACLALRVREHRRRTRIFYLSDFDPAGACMPTSVARKIEYFLRRGGDNLDVALIPLALTRQQVTQLDLPRVPIKQSDRRRTAFEARHGEGSVEIDALQALHPGALARIVTQAIDRYRAPKREAERAIAALAGRINRQIADIRGDVLAGYADDISRLRTEFERAQAAIAEQQDLIAAALDECRRAVAEHEQAIAEQLEQWQRSAAPTWDAIANDIEAALPDLTEIEWARPEQVDDYDEALFDSSRSYLDQIAFYNKRRNGAAS
jgi:hypothetical protein